MPQPKRTVLEGTGPHPLRRRRLGIHGVLVAIDAPEVSSHPWVVDAIDISSSGMGLVLPPEIEEGRRVLLSFKLDDYLQFSRLPAAVRHQMTASGGVAFEGWPSAERLKLLEYLVTYYEGN
jgi:PilZ domain